MERISPPTLQTTMSDMTMGEFTGGSGISLPPRTRSDWSPFYLEFEALQNRLSHVKREFGLRKAVSAKSLTGETRTLAEILDKEVEKIVLFYLKIQGEIAEHTWLLREKQVAMLKGDSIVTSEQIDIMCQHFRDICYEVLELLQFLDFNVTGLRRIIKKHDKMFDLKMGRIYFDARLQGGKRSPLLQLYHQEGIRAIIATLRKGFEDLHEAKYDLNSIKNWQQGGGGESKSIFGDVEQTHHGYGGITDYNLQPLGGLGGETSGTSGSVASSGYYQASGLTRISSSASITGDKNAPQIPRSTYLSRLHTSMPQLQGLEALETLAVERAKDKAKNSSGGYLGGGMKRVSSWLSGQPYVPLPQQASNQSLIRTVSDLEPVLRRLAETEEKVVRSQQRTTSEYLATHSIMALENQGEDEDEDDEEAVLHQELIDGKVTSKYGLFLNLLVTFLYMANQYVVAPTSAEYSHVMGQSEAMSGLIIGLSPAAALVSALVYSIWTNYSFKDPLVAAVFLAVVGNLMYATALQCESPTMLFLGRIVSGLGAPRGIARRYISDHVSQKHRTLASSHFVTASALGLAFGPLVSSVVTYANVNLTYSLGGITLVRMVNVTAPGWIMFVLWFTVLVSVVFGYEEPLKRDRPSNDPSIPLPDLGNGKSRERETFGQVIWSMLTGWPRGGLRGYGDYEAVSSSLEENVVSIELGDLLVDQSAEAERLATLKNAGVGLKESQLTARGRTRTMSSDVMDGAPTIDVKKGSLDSEATTVDESKIVTSGATISCSNGAEEGRGTGVMGGALKGGMGIQIPTKEKSSKAVGYALETEGSFTGIPSPDRSRGFGHYYDGSNDSGSRNNSYTAYQHPYYRPPREEETEADGKRQARGACGHLFDYIDFNVTVILIIYFVNKLGQEMVVSAVPSLTHALFRWDYNTAGFFMAGMGALVLPANILLASFKVQDRLSSLLLFYAAFGAVLIVVDILPADYSTFQYVLGSTLLFTTLCAQEGVIMSLLSKVIPAEMARGTFNSGFLTTEVGTLGRVVSDLGITVAMSHPEVPAVNALFMPIGMGIAVSLALFKMTYDNFEEY